MEFPQTLVDSDGEQWVAHDIRQFNQLRYGDGMQPVGERPRREVTSRREPITDASQITRRTPAEPTAD